MSSNQGPPAPETGKRARGMISAPAGMAEMAFSTSRRFRDRYGFFFSIPNGRLLNPMSCLVSLIQGAQLIQGSIVRFPLPRDRPINLHLVDAHGIHQADVGE